MAAVALGLLCVLGAVGSAPVKTYDQRQQGELNIHAQLDNIVVLLIPTSGFNFLNLIRKNKYGEKHGTADKGSLLHMFQKPVKNDIDKYDFVNEDETSSQNDIKQELVVPMITSQQVILNHEEKKEEHGEKEEEVVAVVEEVGPGTSEKTTDAKKSDTVEVSPPKEHSPTDGTLKLFLSVFGHEEEKDAVNKSDSESKDPGPVENVKGHSEKPAETATNKSEPEADANSTTKPQSESSEEEASAENEQSLPKEESSEKETDRSSDSSEDDEMSIAHIIKPVASKEDNKQASKVIKKISTEETAAPAPKPPQNLEPLKLVEGARREKVIRYKPESKWAPDLVDLMGPAKSKSRELEERQQFASLCSPGVWDTELKTCIMPGEKRSRSELARFLQAMRFGIAVPTH